MGSNVKPSVFPNADMHPEPHACHATCTSAVLWTRIIHHTPRLPHETPSLDPAPRARCHNSPRVPRETSIHTHAATRSRHAELQRPMTTPKRTRRDLSRTLAVVRGRPAHTRRKRVKHDPAPKPPLRNKNPSLRTWVKAEEQ